MRVITVKDALQMEEGETVPAIVGRVKILGDYNEGDNSNGHWSIQNVVITDLEATKSEIKVKVKDRAVLPKTWKNKVIFFSSTKGAKGLQGLKIKEDTYNNKTSKIINCTPTADISDKEPAEGQEQQPPQQQEPQQAAQRPQRQAAPAQQEPEPEPEPTPAPAPRTTEEKLADKQAKEEKALRDGRAFLGRRANLYLLCLMAGGHVRGQFDERNGGEGSMSEEQFQAMVSSLFISADRAGVGDGLPTGNIYDVLEKLKKTKNGNGNGE